jgi:hypothetical protein
MVDDDRTQRVTLQLRSQGRKFAVTGASLPVILELRASELGNRRDLKQYLRIDGELQENIMVSSNGRQSILVYSQMRQEEICFLYIYTNILLALTNIKIIYSISINRPGTADYSPKLSNTFCLDTIHIN